MPEVSDISPCLPFPYLTLLTPAEIWGITSRPQAHQSCPASLSKASLLRWGDLFTGTAVQRGSAPLY